MQDAPNHPADHQATLAELTAMAMDIARVLHTQITAPDATPEAQATQAATFDRIARCIRRTVLLSQHVASPAPKDTTQARRQILRTVEDSIHGAEAPPDNPETLRRELVERLEHPDMERELQTRPIEDTIRDIEHDLGVHPSHTFYSRPRRTPADIARLQAQAEGKANPADPAWTHSTPPPPIRPRERKGPDGLTPSDRALHQAVLSMGRPPGA